MQTIHRAVSFRRMTPCGLDELIYFRSGGMAPTFEATGFLWALNGRTQVSASVPSLMRIELYPIPAAAEVGSIIGTYIRIPATISSSGVADIPARFNPLLFHLVRAFARDETNQEAGRDMEKAMDELERMKISDGQTNRDNGPMTGGWMAQAYDPDERFYIDSLALHE